ncbi:MAG TPA: alpha-amylase family glycosyl hydrolase, partial [Chthoniobacterales bacterium]
MSETPRKTSSEPRAKVPTHQHEKWRLRYGHPLPFGASRVPGGVNFAIYSKHATACTLVLFERGSEKPFVEIPFAREFRMGDVYAMTVFDLDFETIEYGYRFEGPNEPAEGHLFDPKKIVLDPFAREVSGRDAWEKNPATSAVYPHRARIHSNNFEWGHDRPLELPSNDLVIYEMHVRGFTRHPSSGVKCPGTYEGMREKIAYLRDLGVNCVELMPIFEFDEWENPRSDPDTGEALTNYWGYSTIGFFAPKAGYSAAGIEGGQINELKALITELHAAGIEIMLDVVFNHTAEGGDGGPVISFKGIDNKTYYLLNPDKSYANYTGCGNTLNCNHPIVRHFVMDCMRYWAAEFHIDGFRFDLASVLSRDSHGVPMANPPLLESIAYDPVLAHCELVAEAWDAAGLYQVGNFPAYSRWNEWNGRYRDAARKFIKGDLGMAGEMVQRLLGSPDLYAPSGRKPQASINFITCHDGFTLRDLYSYSEKHNLANGEENRDGANDNYSWNCG